jgi:hypothetical protein
MNFQARMVPSLWLLSLIQDFRVFQDKKKLRQHRDTAYERKLDLIKKEEIPMIFCIWLPPDLIFSDTMSLKIMD